MSERLYKYDIVQRIVETQLDLLIDKIVALGTDKKIWQE